MYRLLETILTQTYDLMFWEKYILRRAKVYLLGSTLVTNLLENIYENKKNGKWI